MSQRPPQERLEPWEQWKRGFDAWEARTAVALERALRSPRVLSPVGTALSTVMRARAISSAVLSRVWAGVGLPTRADQERTLHALNQLGSRLADLEERLEELSREPPR